MVVFPNAKINLGLKVTSQRSDGYRNISSVFYPVPELRDALELIPRKENKKDEFHYTGLEIPGNPEENLVQKAVELLRRDFDIPNLEVHLHKAIPMGAGLGGGSADGSFALTALNREFELGLSTGDLEAAALKLGSDCPFFVQNRPVAVSGRGEKMEPIDLSLAEKYLVLVFGKHHISTAEAYANTAMRMPVITPEEIVLSQPIWKWMESLDNDFEGYAFAKHRDLKDVKDLLYLSGAAYASMTGTGSTFYGIFEKKPDLTEFEHAKIPVYCTRL